MNNDEPINIDEASFDQVVLQSPVPVLVDFWAPWCGPCRMIAPVLTEIAKEGAGSVRIAKVDVDQNQGLMMRYGINGIPALLFFEGGELRETLVGAQPKKVIVAKLSTLGKAKEAV